MSVGKPNYNVIATQRKLIIIFSFVPLEFFFSFPYIPIFQFWVDTLDYLCSLCFLILGVLETIRNSVSKSGGKWWRHLFC